MLQGLFAAIKNWNIICRNYSIEWKAHSW
jgi:hypothetical protein